jgi:hypothetical protein
MASSFPNSIDNFTDPLATSPLNSPSHSLQHSNLNDAVNKIETYMGLVYITSASMSGSTFSISNCFTNTYDNYFIIINQMIVASGNSLNLQYKSGATVDSSANYTTQRLYAQSTSVGGTRATGQTSNGIGFTYSGYASQLELTIFQPYLTRQTVVATREIYNETNFPNIDQNQGIINTTTSYDGFVITPEIKGT